ncbi:MAG: hypothetical protein UE068_13090, partial [Paludibacteraceae bacterium]|nr:hypothetical protein [Paludibacteraceae bacterium]
VGWTNLASATKSSVDQKKSYAQCICQSVSTLIVKGFIDFASEKLKERGGISNQKREEICGIVGDALSKLLEKLHVKGLSGSELGEALLSSLTNARLLKAVYGSLADNLCAAFLYPELPPYMEESIRAYVTTENGNRMLNIDLFTSLPSPKIDLRMTTGLIDIVDKEKKVEFEKEILEYEFVKTEWLVPGIESPVKPGDAIVANPYFGENEYTKFGEGIELASSITEFPLKPDYKNPDHKINLPEHDGKKVFPKGVSVIAKYESNGFNSILQGAEGSDNSFHKYDVVSDVRAYHFKAQLPPCEDVPGYRLYANVSATTRNGWKDTLVDCCLDYTTEQPKVETQPEQQTQPVEPKTYYDECHDDDVKDGFKDRVFSVKSTKNAKKEATEQRHHLEYEYDVPMCSGWTNEENGKGIYFSPKIMCGTNDYRRAYDLFYVKDPDGSQKSVINKAVLSNYLNENNNKLVLTYWNSQDTYDFSTIDKIFEYKISNTGTGNVEIMNFDHYYTDDVLAKIVLRIYTKLNAVLFWELAKVERTPTKATALDNIKKIIDNIMSDKLGKCSFSSLVENEIKSYNSTVPLIGSLGYHLNVSDIEEYLGFKTLLPILQNKLSVDDKNNLKIVIKSVINGCSQSASTEMKKVLKMVATTLCHESFDNPKIYPSNPGSIFDVGKVIDFKAGSNASLSLIFNWNSVFLSRIDMIMRIKNNSTGVLMGSVSPCHFNFFRDCCGDVDCVYPSMEYQENTYSKMIPEMWLEKFK